MEQMCIWWEARSFPHTTGHVLDGTLPTHFWFLLYWALSFLLCLQNLTVSVRFSSQQGLCQRCCHTTQDLCTLYWPNRASITEGNAYFEVALLSQMIWCTLPATCGIAQSCSLLQFYTHIGYQKHCYKGSLVPVLPAKQSVQNAWNIIYRCQ